MRNLYSLFYLIKVFIRFNLMYAYLENGSRMTAHLTDRIRLIFLILAISYERLTYKFIDGDWIFSHIICASQGFISFELIEIFWFLQILC